MRRGSKTESGDGVSQRLFNAVHYAGHLLFGSFRGIPQAADGIGLEDRDFFQVGYAPIQLSAEGFGALFNNTLPHLAETLNQPGFQLLNVLADPLIDERGEIVFYEPFALTRARQLSGPVSLGLHIAQGIR
jgi:hypothetical protein